MSNGSRGKRELPTETWKSGGRRRDFPGANVPLEHTFVYKKGVKRGDGWWAVGDSSWAMGDGGWRVREVRHYHPSPIPMAQHLPPTTYGRIISFPNCWRFAMTVWAVATPSRS